MINEIILNLYAQNNISRIKVEEYYETLWFWEKTYKR